jgi:hypothetical protein
MGHGIDEAAKAPCPFCGSPIAEAHEETNLVQRDYWKSFVLHLENITQGAMAGCPECALVIRVADSFEHAHAHYMELAIWRHEHDDNQSAIEIQLTIYEAPLGATHVNTDTDLGMIKYEGLTPGSERTSDGYLSDQENEMSGIAQYRVHTGLSDRQQGTDLSLQNSIAGATELDNSNPQTYQVSIFRSTGMYCGIFITLYLQTSPDFALKSPLKICPH